MQSPTVQLPWSAATCCWARAPHIFERGDNSETGFATKQTLTVVLSITCRCSTFFVESQASNYTASCELCGTNKHYRPFPAGDFYSVANI